MKGKQAYNMESIISESGSLDEEPVLDQTTTSNDVSTPSRRLSPMLKPSTRERRLPANFSSSDSRSGSFSTSFSTQERSKSAAFDPFDLSSDFDSIEQNTDSAKATEIRRDADLNHFFQLMEKQEKRRSLLLRRNSIGSVVSDVNTLDNTIKTAGGTRRASLGRYSDHDARSLVKQSVESQKKSKKRSKRRKKEKVVKKVPDGFAAQLQIPSNRPSADLAVNFIKVSSSLAPIAIDTSKKKTRRESVLSFDEIDVSVSRKVMLNSAA